MNDGSEDSRDPKPPFVPVCGIGASAGGVATLQNLFRLIPDDLDLAYVVILHLSPDYPSALSEIISACTRMPVLQVEDGPTLQRNHVYVIPPDRELVIEGDSVTARAFSEPRGRRAPIDMFFRSIAAGRGDGIAMVLSGAGADGTMGVRAIKEAGGVIMVQEPADAAFASMPQNAVATGVADFIAPIPRLAEQLAEVARSKEAVRSLDLDGSANELRRIIGFLRVRTGHDFASYKRATVMRRVVRRMQVCRTDTLVAYADHLLTAPEETKELFSDLLISVTMFFRDPLAYEALERHVIGSLFDNLQSGSDEGLRIWVVGCASGEEAYSLAMLLHETSAKRKLFPKIQIFATDLDEGALATAREGRYPRSIEADVSEERLTRFFMDEGTHYRVRKELRENVLFATHSLIKDPPFLRLDLITCRNLLIYLERSQQQQSCAIFHYALKPGGFLFLGSAETADAATELFAPIERDARIYAARSHVLQVLPTLPHFAAPERITVPTPSYSTQAERAGLPATLHASALEEVAPASALVDDGQKVLHLSASAGRFILHSAGPISNSLSAVVRPELRLDLQFALARALESKKPTLTLPALVAFDDDKRRIAMHVLPVGNEPHVGARALVLFLDGGTVTDAEAAEIIPDTTPGEVQRLHGELKAGQEALLASRTGHEISIQDLRATNEELQSINEEYRSTAEELETSKEELQSINEELHTVNAELKSKLTSISIAHSDLQNLTAATEIGTLFLDPGLRIKMYTAPIGDLFSVTGADIGRPITDFAHRLDYTGLEQDVRRVLKHLVPVEAEVQSKSGQFYSMRIRPYRTVEDRIEGTVVTFVDITARFAAEAALTRSEQQLRALVEGIPQLVWRASKDGQWKWASPQWTEYTGQIETDSHGWGWLDKLHVDDRDSSRQGWAVAAETGISATECRVWHVASNSYRWFQTRATAVRDAAGIVSEWLGTKNDIDDLRDYQERQAVLVAELQHRTRNLIGVVRSIADMTVKSSTALDDFQDKFSHRLAALARVQSLLSRLKDNDRVTFDELLGVELSALGHPSGSDRVTLEGPNGIALRSSAVQTFAMALHELATNAVKYGALGQPGGKLSVTWYLERAETDEQPRLHVDWLESGVEMPPADALAQGGGTGRTLIERALPYQIGARTSFNMTPSGVHCSISLPVSSQTTMEGATQWMADP